MHLMNFLHPLGVVGWLHEPQSTTVYPELGFPHRVGRYRPVGPPLWDHRLVPRLLELLIYGRISDPGMGLDLPVSGATSTLVGGATLAARRLIVVGVSTPCGVVSTRGIPVFVPRLLDLVVETWKDF